MVSTHLDATVYVATAGNYEAKYKKGVVTKVTASGQVTVSFGLGTVSGEPIRFGADGRKIGDRSSHFQVWLETDTAKVEAILAERAKEARTSKAMHDILETVNAKRTFAGRYGIDHATKTRLLELVSSLEVEDEPEAEPVVTEIPGTTVLSTDEAGNTVWSIS